ncbi:hypothetical protein BT67DRAFT_20004 [Trichocladium antarcticum]|uniref:Uncharacterized protein n=1 Tax=Trichocladium antarcticum TaxID=1450529 RepID=A0AAN6ZI44_9PEZI|nr:hypothetical protein BT67DRAFT_20004 [Trichocladium antarcticum]
MARSLKCVGPLCALTGSAEEQLCTDLHFCSLHSHSDCGTHLERTRPRLVARSESLSCSISDALPKSHGGPRFEAGPCLALRMPDGRQQTRNVLLAPIQVPGQHLLYPSTTRSSNWTDRFEMLTCIIERCECQSLAGTHGAAQGCRVLMRLVVLYLCNWALGGSWALWTLKVMGPPENPLANGLTSLRPGRSWLLEARILPFQMPEHLDRQLRLGH